NYQVKGYESLLECVVQEIGEIKETVIVAVEDSQKRLPGQRTEYCQYLMTEQLAGNRYLTGDIKAETNVCPLCGTLGVDVFSNSLKGAGLNILNMDREGVFPSLDKSQSWKVYALCAACADLLYIYKNHVLKKTGPKKDKIPFTAKVAGESALIIPFCTLDAENRHGLLKNVRNLIKNIPDDVEDDEENLLDILKDEKGLFNLTFLWGDIGQNIENLTGVLSDVLPSRLKELSQFNDLTKKWMHPLFPEFQLRAKLNMQADLSLKALNPLFYRPGGKRAKNINQSKKLFQLKRLIADAVYHKTQIPEKLFWNEILTTAQWWWLEAIKKRDAYGLLHEGKGKKGDFLTTAGWIRHMAWWLYYFKNLEVLEMNNDFFKPEMELLKPYFGPESGINSREKAYVFLIGILYGKLLEVQGARGVNVGSNALTWLKRLTLKGTDIPELYVRIREKLLTYETEKSQKVRELIHEIGKLGISLGDSIELNQTQTNYYLLLGQSMTTIILKKEGT
ncbi:MAG: CRISPR-associated protein, partial [Desulfobacterales bacterium]|nr:CRISPR-associated protein [Desulfobacterales bacterium]